MNKYVDIFIKVPDCQEELGPLLTSLYCRFIYKQDAVQHWIFRKIDTNIANSNAVPH